MLIFPVASILNVEGKEPSDLKLVVFIYAKMCDFYIKQTFFPKYLVAEKKGLLFMKVYPNNY